MDVRQKRQRGGNGKQLEEICIENDLVSGNTILIRKGRAWKTLEARYKYDGAIQRQVDYFTISEK